MAGNREAWTLWCHVRTQWRAGGFGVVGLDYPAVRAEARALGVMVSVGLMRKLQALERYELEKMVDDSESGVKGKHTGAKKDPA